MKAIEHAVRISFRREDFRVAIGTPFRPVAAGALAATEALFLVTGTGSLPMLLFVVPSAVLVVCAAVLLLMCLSYKFEVGPDGIDWYDYRWKIHRTSWGSVRSTRQFRLFGLSYLIFNVSDQPRSIWIPLFVTRYDLLRDLLITYADSTHHLEDKLTKAA